MFTSTKTEYSVINNKINWLHFDITYVYNNIIRHQSMSIRLKTISKTQRNNNANTHVKY